MIKHSMINTSRYVLSLTSSFLYSGCAGDFGSAALFGTSTVSVSHGDVRNNSTGGSQPFRNFGTYRGAHCSFGQSALRYRRTHFVLHYTVSRVQNKHTQLQLTTNTQSVCYFTTPGPSPSITQQLIDGQLFRGQVTSQEVHGVLGHVRREDHSRKIGTATILQYLNWSITSKSESRLPVSAYFESMCRKQLMK